MARGLVCPIPGAAGGVARKDHQCIFEEIVLDTLECNRKRM